MAYSIDILDKNLAYVATVHNTPELDKSGFFLEFSQRLSSWGEARFRVATHDPLFTATGDIFQPWANHVRVKRGNAIVFQGVIVKNPSRTRKYIEVVAYSYLYLLNVKRIVHDASVTTGDNLDNYLTMQSGTMASQINTMLTKAIASAGQMPIRLLTLGAIENPQYPTGYVDATGAALTGAWTFTSNFKLQYSYVPVFKVISALGIYAQADFEITPALVFNFKLNVGNSQPGLVFNYGAFGGTYGNIEDFNIPLDGVGMANDIMGVAADTSGQTFHTAKSDSTSVAQYGAVEGVAAFSDVKDNNTLVTRLQQELVYTSNPASEIHIWLNSQAPPLGQYGVGDIVTVKIKQGIYAVDAPRKIVAIFARIHLSGKESIRIVTNQPRNQ